MWLRTRTQTLNDELSDALFRDKKVPQGGFPKTIMRKELATLFEEKLIPYHAVQVNDRVVVKKGSHHSIDVVTKKVKGAKSLQTMVYHTDEFSIDIRELLKSLSKACASRCVRGWSMMCSGCIHKDNEGAYVQLQGRMGTIVKNCLIKEYKVPAKYINVN